MVRLTQQWALFYITVWLQKNSYGQMSKKRTYVTYVNSLAVELEKSVNEILDEMDRDVEH